MKNSISVLNFSTESAKKWIIYGFLFLIALYSAKNDNKHPSEMRNYYHTTVFKGREKIFSEYCVSLFHGNSCGQPFLNGYSIF